MMANRILLLEDEPFIAMDLEGLLEEHSYGDVVTLTTCADAVAWLEVNTPSTAIVDPRLSDGLCTAVVRHLTNQQIPFVVYSGETASLADEEPAFSNGEYLSKPAMPEEVIAALKRALAAG